jgi:hypothetical protein
MGNQGWISLPRGPWQAEAKKEEYREKHAVNLDLDENMAKTSAKTEAVTILKLDRGIQKSNMEASQLYWF